MHGSVCAWLCLCVSICVQMGTSANMCVAHCVSVWCTNKYICDGTGYVMCVRRCVSGCVCVCLVQGCGVPVSVGVGLSGRV